ncbi:hypothetical protein RA290_08460 [Pantoea agglomerans]|uniref:hypothetical protein n=1 Tax=Enterobacter agglomerans TaxID=549 RepID=UPI003AAE5DFD
MNRILVVDDDEKRGNKIVTLLSEQHNISPTFIDFTDSIKGAKKFLKRTYYTLALIDMGLPELKGGNADPFGGVRLLESIYSEPAKKPAYIIGFTALIDNLEEKTKAYLGKGFDLVHAKTGDFSWLAKEHAKINHFIEVFERYERGNNDVSILTVHGIRTYGDWQEDLSEICGNNESTAAVKFYHYKNALISTRTFMNESKRDLIFSDFKDSLNMWLENNRSRRLICIAHSFGTFLLMKALNEIVDKSLLIELDLIILSGSILPQDYKFPLLELNKNISIVNECAIHDYALIMNECFTHNGGLGGVLGFNGFQSGSLKNRYHLGGHDCFFESDFINNYWIPMINDCSAIKDVNFGGKQQLKFKILLRISQVFRGVLNKLFSNAAR